MKNIDTKKVIDKMKIENVNNNNDSFSNQETNDVLFNNKFFNVNRNIPNNNNFPDKTNELNKDKDLIELDTEAILQMGMKNSSNNNINNNKNINLENINTNKVIENMNQNNFNNNNQVKSIKSKFKFTK